MVEWNEHWACAGSTRNLIGTGIRREIEERGLDRWGANMGVSHRALTEDPLPHLNLGRDGIRGYRLIKVWEGNIVGVEEDGIVVSF